MTLKTYPILPDDQTERCISLIEYGKYKKARRLPCTRKAKFTVEGERLCSLHAGQLALREAILDTKRADEAKGKKP